MERRKSAFYCQKCEKGFNKSQYYGHKCQTKKPESDSETEDSDSEQENKEGIETDQFEKVPKKEQSEEERDFLGNGDYEVHSSTKVQEKRISQYFDSTTFLMKSVDHLRSSNTGVSQTLVNGVIHLSREFSDALLKNIEDFISCLPSIDEQAKIDIVSHLNGLYPNYNILNSVIKRERLLLPDDIRDYVDVVSVIHPTDGTVCGFVYLVRKEYIIKHRFKEKSSRSRLKKTIQRMNKKNVFNVLDGILATENLLFLLNPRDTILEGYFLDYKTYQSENMGIVLSYYHNFHPFYGTKRENINFVGCFSKNLIKTIGVQAVLGVFFREQAKYSTLDGFEIEFSEEDVEVFHNSLISALGDSEASSHFKGTKTNFKKNTKRSCRLCVKPTVDYNKLDKRSELLSPNLVDYILEFLDEKRIKSFFQFVERPYIRTVPFLDFENAILLEPMHDNEGGPLQKSTILFLRSLIIDQREFGSEELGIEAVCSKFRMVKESHKILGSVSLKRLTLKKIEKRKNTLFNQKGKPFYLPKSWSIFDEDDCLQFASFIFKITEEVKVNNDIVRNMMRDHLIQLELEYSFFPFQFEDERSDHAKKVLESKVLLEETLTLKDHMEEHKPLYQEKVSCLKNTRAYKFESFLKYLDDNTQRSRNLGITMSTFGARHNSRALDFELKRPTVHYFSKSVIGGMRKVKAFTLHDRYVRPGYVVYVKENVFYFIRTIREKASTGQLIFECNPCMNIGRDEESNYILFDPLDRKITLIEYQIIGYRVCDDYKKRKALISFKMRLYFRDPDKYDGGDNYEKYL